MPFPQIKQWRWKDKNRGSDSSFNVMIVRGLGKVRSLNISSRLLLWAIVVIVLYLAFSVVAISRYFGELNSNAVQLNLLQQLQNEIEGTKRTLYRARQRLAFLEDHLGNSLERQGKQVNTPGPETIRPVPAKSVIQEQTVEESDAAKQTAPVVGIKNLTIRKTGGRLSVKFRLIKRKPGRSQIKGYIFLIAANRESDPPQLWTYPKAVLKDGEPVNHKQGELFKVRNYRIIRRKFFLESVSNPPSFLRILVYDDSGKLILDKEFPIDRS